MRKIKFISILLVLSMLLTVPVFAFSTGFTDVSEKATYAEAVSYLADAGILRGTASGRFAPNEKITVSQWATMLCRAFDTEPEGVSWQEVGANAVQIAVYSSWLDPTAVGDENGFICRGELYRTAFAAAGIPIYDATLYGLDWHSPGENALRVGKKIGLCAENKTAAELVTRAEAAQLLHAVLTQNLTVTPPDTPVTVENLIQWNVNAFLLELRKVPQPILDAFNENGWTPLTAGMANTVRAIRFSSPPNIGSPMPAGSPSITHSITPPTESPSAFACAISSGMVVAAPSETAGNGFPATGASNGALSVTVPMDKMRARMRTPSCSSSCMQIPPAMHIGAVSRPEKCPPPLASCAPPNLTCAV